MSLPAQLEPRHAQSDARAADRRRLTLQVQGSTPARGYADVTILDLSETGALIETGAELAVGETLDVQIPEAGATAATIVWSSGRFYGCAFTGDISKGAVSAALLRSPATALPSVPAPGGVDYAADQAPDSNKWPLAATMWLLVALAAASWSLIGLALWLML
jgi:hypothetical protein